jgi:hypothetical protein
VDGVVVRGGGELCELTYVGGGGIDDHAASTDYLTLVST